MAPILQFFGSPQAGRNRTRVLLLSALIIALAAVDWREERYLSLGFLYLLLVMMSAPFLPEWGTVLLAAFCAALSQIFSPLDPLHAIIRFGFETLALVGCGLCVAETARSRRLGQEAEQRLRALVETTPSPIVTVNQSGFIECANHAAEELMVPPGGNLIGQPVAAFLPELHYALRDDHGPLIPTTIHCRGLRGNGGSFSADVCFSRYLEGPAPKLAAVIAGVTEERAANGPKAAFVHVIDRISLHDRELQVLRLVVQGHANKEIASTMDISESVVKNVLQQLFAKTEVRTRGQLVRVAFERYRDLL